MPSMACDDQSTLQHAHYFQRKQTRISVSSMYESNEHLSRWNCLMSDYRSEYNLNLSPTRERRCVISTLQKTFVFVNNDSASRSQYTCTLIFAQVGLV